jgi:hypothetical protein
MYYIGLDVHKGTISYCVKDGSGTIHAEGTIPATRFDLGSGSRRRAAFFLDQESYQLLWIVRGGEEFRQRGPTHATVKTTQQAFTDHTD